MRPVCRAVSLAGMPKTPAAEVVAETAPSG